MQNPPTSSRYVRLTDSGVKRLQSVRRRYRATMDEIGADPGTPSINTIKRVFQQQPIFVSTLERIWDYFQKRAAENRERLPYLIEGEDFAYLEPEALPAEKPDEPQTASRTPAPSGWISRSVPRPNRLFTGRRDVLDRLHAALHDSSAALVSDPQALTGLGGIGKTQTATAYIYEHWRDYTRVFWVTADTPDSLNDGLAGLAEELGLIAAAPATKNQALRMMHDWFAAESGWLLVLDNADDLDALSAYFPRYHKGRLIIASRASNTIKWASPIALSKFGPEEGATLLLRRAGVLDIRQPLSSMAPETVREAMELSEELDGLPLAIDQAGAYLAETGASVTDYRARFGEQGLQLLDSTAEPEHASVSVTFTLAMRQMAERTVHGAAAAEMVHLAAFLAPEEIPEAVFAAHPFAEGAGAAPLEEVCAGVCRYSLASRNATNRTLTVHRLVQRVVQDGMTEEERRDGRGRAVRTVAAATPDFEYEDWSLCDQLLPQWRVCSEYIREDAIATEEAAYLLYQTGRYLRSRVQFAEAESCIRSALGIAESVYGPVHQVTADYVDELACLCRVLDRLEESEELHTRAIDILERTDGPDQLVVSSKLHNKAILYIHMERYADAEPLFLRALAIHNAQPEPDHLLVATAMTQLAGVYRMQKEFDKAETYCRRALETYERLLEPGHIEIATGSNNLALLYLTMGRYQEAEALYRRALSINEQARGPEHPETGTVVWGLARVRWRQNARDEADAHFRRAISIYTKHIGPENSRTLRIVSNYSEFQREGGPA